MDILRTLRQAIRANGDEEIFRPDPWGDEELEDFTLEDDWGPSEEEPGLEGLGNFFKKVAHAISNIAVAPIKLISKKAAANLQKIDNKVIAAADKVWTKTGDLLHKIGHKIGKNWKWIAVIVAIAITIYTMGAGATIAAHMISGMQALGHAIAAGAAAVGHAVGIGTGAAAAGTGAGTGAAAVGAGTTAATAGSSSWIITAGKLALTAATALRNKAKVSDLSQAQAQSMLQAQDAGYELGVNDPQLRQALETRAQIPGLGIPTDAYGNPLVDPSQVGAGILQPDGSVIPGGPTMAGSMVASLPGYGGGGGAGVGGSGLPGWLLPAAAVGGLTIFALASRR